MKLWNYTVPVLLAVMLAACSKDNSLLQDDTARVASVVIEDQRVVITGWEAPAWSMHDSSDFRISRHERALPELTDEVLATGVVMMFVRNIPSPEGFVTGPLLTPFHPLPEGVHPAYDEKWYYTARPQMVNVQFRTNKYLFVPDALVMASNDARFRIFMIPGETLQQMGLDRLSILQIPYERLVSIFGVSE